MFVSPFSVMLATPAGAQNESIMPAHGIPDSDVDIVVNGGVEA